MTKGKYTGQAPVEPYEFPLTWGQVAEVGQTVRVHYQLEQYRGQGDLCPPFCYPDGNFHMDHLVDDACKNKLCTPIYNDSYVKHEVLK